MENREAVRANLVLKTIEEIERVGLSKVTVRGLAEAAGVNVAAVSYYFGSKANLLDAALAQTLAHMLSDLEEMASQLETDPQGSTTNMLTYLLEGALRYPNVTRAHVHDVFVGVPSTGLDQNGVLPVGLAPVVSRLAHAISSATNLPLQHAQLRSVQAFSAALFPAFLQGFFQPAGVLMTAESRRDYLEEVVRTAFAPATR